VTTTIADAFQQLRDAAQARADALPLPSAALEDWRYVDVKAFSRELSPAVAYAAAALAGHRAAGLACAVVVDGRLAETPSGLPPGTLQDLGALTEQAAAALIEGWSRELGRCADASACWSLADGRGGARISASRAGGGAPTTLHLLLVSTGGRSGCRLAIEVGADAQLDLVISHLDLAAARSSVGIEAVVHDRGRLRVDELQYSCGDQATALLLSHATLHLHERAQASWVACHQGGALVRTAIHAHLHGDGAAFDLGFLSVLSGSRQDHLLTRVHHHVGGTTSTQLVKTIADGRAQASFDGLIAIDAHTDGASARQHHHNLLLSPGARVDTRPQLDIAADDVQAAHGATVGRPNPDELFYLRSRGIAAVEALAMLRRGFAREPVLMLAHPAVRMLAERALLGSLAGA
jgi:Fe-S cluster assembly protein SufD